LSNYFFVFFNLLKLGWLFIRIKGFWNLTKNLKKTWLFDNSMVEKKQTVHSNDCDDWEEWETWGEDFGRRMEKAFSSPRKIKRRLSIGALLLGNNMAWKRPGLLGDTFPCLACSHNTRLDRNAPFSGKRGPWTQLGRGCGK